jgi:two-component system cell cycle sensor histidine kinase/response regulator CckA
MTYINLKEFLHTMTEKNQPLILIVDDNAVNLKFVFYALQQANYKVLASENGEAALELVARTKPDLILLDILMPGIDGFETCRRLKANEESRDIPVIFTSALSESVDKVKGFEVGAADYVTKPFDIAEVIARINTHLTVHRLQTDLRDQNERLRLENEKRRRVHEALRESRERYRLLADNATDMISRQTLGGNYLYVSPACFSLLGYRIEEMIGRSIFDFIHPDDLGLVRQNLKPLEDCPATTTFSYRVRRKAGTYIWLETVSKTLCESDLGRPFEIVSVSRDVTERVELTEKLQDQNRELDAFAHTVAHDLKNPFGLVISTVDFLISMRDRLSEEQVDKFLGNIRVTGEKGIDIITSLLLLASIRTDDIVLEVVDTGALIDQVQQRLSVMFEENNGSLTVPDEWPPALGYNPWIEEVWINYISNGLKYGGDSPQLELGAAQQEDGTVKFWVSDHGPGISPEDQDKLFAEFVRLDEVRSEGHGLGLSIVRRIVDKLGGHVGVEGEVGSGSTFYFTLPAPSG